MGNTPLAIMNTLTPEILYAVIRFVVITWSFFVGLLGIVILSVTLLYWIGVTQILNVFSADTLGCYFAKKLDDFLPNLVLVPISVIMSLHFVVISPLIVPWIYRMTFDTMTYGLVLDVTTKVVMISSFVTAIVLFFAVPGAFARRVISKIFGKTEIKQGYDSVIGGFNAIGGYDDVKTRLKVTIRQIISDTRGKKSNGILLYGPPGCGKSFFGEKAAEEFNIPFIRPTIDEFKSKWINQSAEQVGRIFREAIEQQPCVLFIEEADTLLSSRDDDNNHGEDAKVTNAFLQHIDSIRKNNHKVVLMAATNNYDKIDAAAKRASRFDYHIKIDKPDKKAVGAVIDTIVTRLVAENARGSVKVSSVPSLRAFIKGIVIAFYCVALLMLSWVALAGKGDSLPVRFVSDIPWDVHGSGMFFPHGLPVVLLKVFYVVCVVSLALFIKAVFTNAGDGFRRYKTKARINQSLVDEYAREMLVKYFEGIGISEIESAFNMAYAQYGDKMDAQDVIDIDKEGKLMRRDKIAPVSWDQIVLNQDTLAKIKGIALSISNYRMQKERYTKPPGGMLLYSEPGCGKTLIAKAFASNADCAFYNVKASDLLNKWEGGTEKKVGAIFEKARANSPAVVFIDDAETLFESRDKGAGSSVLNSILVEMDGFAKGNDLVFVIIATNYPDKLDRAFRERLGVEIKIPKPDTESREKLFIMNIAKRPNEGEFDYKHLAKLSEGQSGRSIENLINEALMLRVNKPLRYEDIIKVIDMQKGANKPEMHYKYTWDDIVLADEVLAQLKAVEKIFREPDRAAKMGLEGKIYRCFSGPPGCGKTFAAAVLASVVNADFKECTAADFKKGIVGGSEQAVKDVFAWLKNSPAAILYIDEADSILFDAGQRMSDSHDISLVNQFLSELDGFNKSAKTFAVIISTNYPERLDPRILSRFANQIKFELPDREGRMKLFNSRLKTLKTEGIDTKWLADNTEGCSGRDIDNIVKKAGESAFMGDSEVVGKKDFFSALAKFSKG